MLNIGLFERLIGLFNRREAFEMCIYVGLRQVGCSVWKYACVRFMSVNGDCKIFMLSLNCFYSQVVLSIRYGFVLVHSRITGVCVSFTVC